MRAFFARDAMAMVETNKHTSVLGIAVLQCSRGSLEVLQTSESL
jgi:hypothetical protein